MRSCIRIQTFTNSWGNEVSWIMRGTTSKFTCVSNQAYYNNCCYGQECCMPTIDDEFDVTCTDNFGDGWHGGFLVINGRTICEGFQGHNFTTVISNPIKRDCKTGRTKFSIKI